MPLRRCVGCCSSKEKSELVRFVARNGRLTIDTTRSGSLHGRGLYICPSEECLNRALKKHRKKALFSLVLKENVAVPDRETLWHSIAEITKRKVWQKRREKIHQR